jgi:hypothetical protein
MNNWNPASEMSGTERFVTGFDKGITNLGQGAAQMIAGLKGDPKLDQQWRDKIAEERKLTQPLMDTGAGFAGNLTGGMVATAPIGGGVKAASLPLTVARGVAEGTATGALAPEAEQGERLSNIGLSAGVAGGLPLVGGALRKTVGEMDPALVRAREVLSQYGIKMPEGATAPGALSKSIDSVSRHIPFLNAYLKQGYDEKRDVATDALFKMLGSEKPTNNQALLDVINSAGERVGDVTRGKTVDLGGIEGDISNVLSQYGNLLPSQRSSEIGNIANDLLDIAHSGQPFSGSAYQTVRSDLGAEAARATPAKAGALKGLKESLDRKFKDTLGPDEIEQLADAEAKYRLANSLRNLDIKDGRIDLSKARTAVEKKARKGPVMAEARDLLSAVEDIVPKGSSGLSPQGAIGTGLAMTSPLAVGKALVMGVPLRALLSTGKLQKAAGNETIQELTARLLRGLTQSSMNN